MPKTKEQYEEIRNKSQEAIMDAALELFSTKGFHSTSISQIAKAAGISKGLMYNYFDSKEDLLRAILMKALKEGTEMVDKELNLPQTPKEQLRHIIENFRDGLKNDLKKWKLLTSLSFQEGPGKMIHDEVLPGKADSIKGFIHLFELLGFEKAKLEAYSVAATLDGIVLQYITIGEDYPLDEMVNHLLEKYCKEDEE